MNKCTQCDHEFTYREKVLGYWAGWKTTCPKCNIVHWTTYRNRYETMGITMAMPFLVGIVISLALNITFPAVLVILIVLAFPFSLGAPLVIKFTETEKPSRSR